jgi:hypothetical protein
MEPGRSQRLQGGQAPAAPNHWCRRQGRRLELALLTQQQLALLLHFLSRVMTCADHPLACGVIPIALSPKSCLGLACIIMLAAGARIERELAARGS